MRNDRQLLYCFSHFTNSIAALGPGKSNMLPISGLGFGPGGNGPRFFAQVASISLLIIHASRTIEAKVATEIAMVGSRHKSGKGLAVVECS